MTLADNMAGARHLWTLCDFDPNDIELENTGTFVLASNNYLEGNVGGGTITDAGEVCASVTPCNGLRFTTDDPLGGSLKGNSSDTGANFPALGPWGIEVYFRLPDKPSSGQVDIITDGGDDFWLRLIPSGSTTVVEATIRNAVDEISTGTPDVLVTMTGSVPNDGCWHQIGWTASLGDSTTGILYLDGELADQNDDFHPYDFSGGGLPAFLRWGAFLGTTGLTVDLTHIGVYNETISSNQIIDNWALFDGCCGREVPLRPLRQLQRDDSLNSPRVSKENNSPSSRQYSLRASAGSNTYL